MDVAWGCKPHTGWAVAVLVAGTAAKPVVLDRRRVQLCPDDVPRQAYHAAESLPLERAAALVDEVERSTTTATATVVAELCATARTHGELASMAVIGQPRELPELRRILGSHQLLHAAEGELYRAALADAADDAHIPVVSVPGKGAVSAAAAALGVSADRLAARLRDLRRDLGAPWQADHRDATAAALMALHLSR